MGDGSSLGKLTDITKRSKAKRYLRFNLYKGVAHVGSKEGVLSAEALLDIEVLENYSQFAKGVVVGHNQPLVTQ